VSLGIFPTGRNWRTVARVTPSTGSIFSDLGLLMMSLLSGPESSVVDRPRDAVRDNNSSSALSRVVSTANSYLIGSASFF